MALCVAEDTCWVLLPISGGGLVGVWAALFFLCVLPDNIQNMPEDVRGNGLTCGGGKNDSAKCQLEPAERPRPPFRNV